MVVPCVIEMVIIGVVEVIMSRVVGQVMARLVGLVKASNQFTTDTLGLCKPGEEEETRCGLEFHDAEIQKKLNSRKV